MENILKWLHARGTEWSTLRGIIGVGAAVALIIKPESYVDIFAVATAALGLVETIRSENAADSASTDAK